MQTVLHQNTNVEIITVFQEHRQNPLNKCSSTEQETKKLLYTCVCITSTTVYPKMKQWKAMFLQVHSAREPAAAAFEIEEVAHQLEIEKGEEINITNYYKFTTPWFLEKYIPLNKTRLWQSRVTSNVDGWLEHLL